MAASAVPSTVPVDTKAGSTAGAKAARSSKTWLDHELRCQRAEYYLENPKDILLRECESRNKSKITTNEDTNQHV